LINLGLTDEKCDCATGLVLSLGGNAIIISRELSRLGVRDAATLREQMWNDRNKKIYTFATTSPLSSQYFNFATGFRLLRGLLAQICASNVSQPSSYSHCSSSGISTGSAPPNRGFSRHPGRPWNLPGNQRHSRAAPPEKVLLVRKDFAETRSDEHQRLIAALIEACYLCEQPENRSILASSSPASVC